MKWKDLKRKIDEVVQDDDEIGWIEITWPCGLTKIEVSPIKDMGDPPMVSIHD